MKITFLATLMLLATTLLAAAAETTSLTAQEFLQEVRRPLRRDAWGEVGGHITHQNEKQPLLTGTLRVRITFTIDSLHAQLVLNDRNVYGFEQKHASGLPVTTTLDLPEQEFAPTLADFGVTATDLTFAFIYWDFVAELPSQRTRLRTCRVMQLAHPAGNGSVQVWFDAELGFPLEVHWFRTGETNPWRKLEMKGAKKYANELWFVKEMRLEGKDWKTRVVFDNAEINPITQD